MKQEDKELLLQDLCSRLPYGVKCKVWYNDKILNIKCTGIDFYTNTVNLDIPEDDNAKVYVDNIKPYLFPLSSMTEEQKREYNSLRDFVPTYHYEYGDIVEDTELYDNWESINYLIANHFDYRRRGLIPMGLAIDATGLNIY